MQEDISRKPALVAAVIIVAVILVFAVYKFTTSPRLATDSGKAPEQMKQGAGPGIMPQGSGPGSVRKGPPFQGGNPTGR